MLLIVANLFVVSSCSDTYDLHQKYLTEGETVYTNKVDSIVTLPGENRLKISGYISNAFNVKEIVVYWNNGEKSQKFPYTKSANFTDALDLIVTDLEENTYQFDVYSLDADGNKSVKVTTFGTSYGETYRSNLEPRLLKSFYYANGAKNATIKFNIKSELTRDTEVKFTNLNSEEVIVSVGKDEEQAVLENIDITKDVMYRTNYVPTVSNEITGEETSIDEFASDWASYTIPSTLKPILETFTFEPVIGGVLSYWNNVNNLDVTFQFKITVDGSVVSKTTTSNNSSDSYEIKNMDPGTQEIEIVATDVYGNSFSEEFTVATKPLEPYSRALWSVIDFSSEEPKEETWGNGGQAIHAIDDSEATFWHTAWDQSQPDYPHHFTVDMGEEISILAFEVLGRTKNNNRAAGEHEFYVSSDNVNWTLVASYSGELSTSKILIEATETKGRYFRYNAVSAGSGATNYTFMADLVVYAK